MKKTLFALLFVVFLAACSENGAGVAAGSGSSNTSEIGSTINKVKSINSTDEASTSIKMPAIALISEALSTRLPGKNEVISEDMREGSDSDFKLIRERTTGVMEEKNKSPEEYRKFVDGLPPRLGKVFRSAESDQALGDGLIRMKLERRMLGCTGPMNGWELNPIDQKKEAQIYMKSYANMCDFANLIYTEIAGKIGNRAIKDPDAAIEDVLNSWDAIPIQTLEAVWKKVAENNENLGFVADLTGVKGVKFNNQSGVYWNQGAGFTVAKNGVTWFGDGSISGKVIDFNLRSSLSTKVEKSKESRTSQGSQTGGKTGAEVGTK